jgi:hypothetical protein
MQKTLTSMLIGAGLLSVGAAGSAQTHKAGLWQVTTKTTIQQPGDPEGHFNGNSLGDQGGGTATLPACYTSDLISKYGFVLPPSLRDCELSNIVQTSDSFRADLTCKGSYNGKGSVESTWTDEDHVTGKVHFISKTRDDQPRIVRWTQDVNAEFKNADCGSVRPRHIPVKPEAH